jgi:transposase
VPSASQAEFDELIGRRHQVVRAHVSLRQSFKQCAYPLPALKQSLADLQLLIEQIDERMQQLIDQQENLTQAAQHLRTIVGFGPLLSASLAHALHRRPYRNADAFVAYIGYDPRVRDSGQWRGRRFLSKHGSPELRRLLFAAAMSACKTTTWHAFYQRYRDRGFSSTAALVILARKLARTAFSIVKYEQDFSPERIQGTCVHP